MGDAEFFELMSAAGVRVRLRARGASIAEVFAPDRGGASANVALSPAGERDETYAGATLAPFAGRIRGGLLRVEGRAIQLSRNDGGHQLHGGPDSLAFRLWRTDGVRRERNAQSVCFFAEAEHGRDGFPGDRRFSVLYTLREDGRLDIRLSAETDRPTRVNLSNHAYWNLRGGASGTALGHFLQIAADEVYENDAEHLPLRRRAARGPFDFRAPASLAERMRTPDPQLAIARGYNHAFVLPVGRDADAPAATLFDPGSGRRLRLYTDQPVLRLYSGGFLPVPSSALALEAEGFPDAPDVGAPGDPLTPGRPCERHISFALDAPG
ncbi:MAG: galactose mutarotase [Clostridiales bacterium]|nr:galactose mutarotase [Clostridiales bacterium]